MRSPIHSVEVMMSNVFLHRIFYLNNREEVKLKVFEPQIEPGLDWRCDIEIDWPSRKWSRRIFGIDPIQSIWIAMQIAHLELISTSVRSDGTLTWLGNSCLGLPTIGVSTSAAIGARRPATKH